MRILSGCCRPGLLRLPRSRRLWFVAVLLIAFVLGAAVMHFRFYPFRTLSSSFHAVEQRLAEDITPPPAAGPFEKAPAAAKAASAPTPGYTLLSFNKGEALLVSLEGEVVHRWHMPGGLVKALKIEDADADTTIPWQKCHLFPNGNLLILCGDENSVTGRGLALLNKDSELLWAYAADLRRDFDVGEDGRIYALLETK